MMADLDWRHLAAFIAGLGVVLPVALRSGKRVADAIADLKKNQTAQMAAHIATLQANEATREGADQRRMGGMIALTNLVNAAMDRVHELGERHATLEAAQTKLLRDFNGILNTRLQAVESTVRGHGERLSKLEGAKP